MADVPSCEELDALLLWFEKWIRSSLELQFKAVRDTIATAIVYFKRFFLFHHVTDCPPQLVMLCCMNLANKVEAPKSSDPDDPFAVTTEELAKQFNVERQYLNDIELRLLSGIGFHLRVFHPYRPFDGLLADMQLQHPELDAEAIRGYGYGLLQNAEHTDMGFLYTPGLIALACMYKTALDLRLACLEPFLKRELRLAEEGGPASVKRPRRGPHAEWDGEWALLVSRLAPLLAYFEPVAGPSLAVCEQLLGRVALVRDARGDPSSKEYQQEVDEQHQAMLAKRAEGLQEVRLQQEERTARLLGVDDPSDDGELHIRRARCPPSTEQRQRLQARLRKVREHDVWTSPGWTVSLRSGRSSLDSVASTPSPPRFTPSATPTPAARLKRTSTGSLNGQTPQCHYPFVNSPSAPSSPPSPPQGGFPCAHRADKRTAMDDETPLKRSRVAQGRASVPCTPLTRLVISPLPSVAELAPFNQ